MKLTKCRIGDCVEVYNEACGNPNLTVDDVSGVNRDKEFFEPSKQVGSDTSKYKIVPPNYFACNLMHVGRDRLLPIALNHTNKNKYISPAYTVFRIKEDTSLIREYFFMMLKSDERDRYFWFHTDSSVRDGMSWDDFCDLTFKLPTVEIQQKYVNVYRALLENQRSYERGLEDLKLVCDAYIEELRKKITSEPIGKYLMAVTDSNGDKKVKHVQGVESSGSFMDTRAKMQGIDVGKYTVVRKGNIAYNPSRINLGSIALYRDEKPCIISPMYSVFKVVDETRVLPEYLMLWFGRREFQRYTWFYASGSVRDTFDYNLMEEVELPIPSIEIQQDIVNIYNSYIMRKDINECLKAQIKDLCPILIRGAVEEGKRE